MATGQRADWLGNYAITGVVCRRSRDHWLPRPEVALWGAFRGGIHAIMQSPTAVDSFRLRFLERLRTTIIGRSAAPIARCYGALMVFATVVVRLLDARLAVSKSVIVSVDNVALL